MFTAYIQNQIPARQTQNQNQTLHPDAHLSSTAFQIIILSHQKEKGRHLHHDDTKPPAQNGTTQWKVKGLGSTSIPAPVSPSRLPKVMNPLDYCGNKHLQTGAGLVWMGQSPETRHISLQSQNDVEITLA